MIGAGEGVAGRVERRRPITGRVGSFGMRGPRPGGIGDPRLSPARSRSGPAPASRARSPTASIARMRPPATVKPSADTGRPSGATTTPATPLTRAGRTYGASRANMSARLATALAPRTSTESCGRSGAAVGAQHDVGVEHGDEGVEVAVAGGGEERVDDRALAGRVGVAARRRRPGPGGGPGWRAGGWRRASGPRSARSRRTARRTCRAGRRPAARPATASRARRAARARPSRPAAPPARGPPSGRGDDRVGHVRLQRLLAARAPRRAACSRQTRATTVVSQPPRFVDRRRRRCGSAAATPPARRRRPR